MVSNKNFSTCSNQTWQNLSPYESFSRITAYSWNYPFWYLIPAIHPRAVVWSERDGISNTGSPSVIVLWRCATVHQCTGERSTSLWASAKALWTLSSTCYCSEVQHYKSTLASPNAPESSLNSNSIRLLLCMFVSFRSHLAITGANLWSAPGYSVKMTDLSHLPPPPPPLPTPWLHGFHYPRCPYSYWRMDAINLTF